VKEEDVEKERKALEKEKQRDIDFVLTYVDDPNLLYEFSVSLDTRESALLLQVAEKFFKRITAVEELRRVRDKCAENIKILKEEQSLLEQEKKTLSAQQQELLGKLEDEQKKTVIPGYISNAKQHDALVLKMVKLIFQSTWNMKQQVRGCTVAFIELLSWNNK